jgi:hypothetical protein
MGLKLVHFDAHQVFDGRPLRGHVLAMHSATRSHLLQRPCLSAVRPAIPEGVPSSSPTPSLTLVPLVAAAECERHHGRVEL